MKKANDIFNILDDVKGETPNGLQLIVLAPSGDGKSYLAGTYPGKTLLIYGKSEHHGVKSACKPNNAQIIPISWGQRKDGSTRSPDASLGYIKKCLQPDALKAAGVDFIAIDSLADLMKTISETQEFVGKCLSANGKHVPWKESDAYVSMIDPILEQLRYLQEFHGIDFMITADLEISERTDKGLIVSSKPRAPSFHVAERVVLQFQDIIMMSRVIKKDGTSEPVIQMGASATRVSRDLGGSIIKTVDFTPRLADVKEVPALIKCDLKEILKLKGVSK